MNPFASSIARRDFLSSMATGLGATAFSELLGREASGSEPGAALPSSGAAHADGSLSDYALQGHSIPHHPPTAKRVIFLYMAGGPSQFETFDEKPLLTELNGNPIPQELTAGVKLAFLQNAELTCFGSEYQFHRCGESGQNISELLPNIQKIADDICIVRTQETEQVNHDPAHMFLNTGTAITGRPSMGSWISYGLGSLAEDLPTFVVMRSGPEGQPVPQVAWHNGFLPGRHSGVEFYSTGSPLNYLQSPAGIDAALQRRTLDSLARLNQWQHDQTDDPEILTRLSQYELAYKMQSSVPQLADFASEDSATKELYGVGDAPDGSFGSNCLMARRMAEQGVRFIQLYHTGWDHHSRVAQGIKARTKEVDQGTAALISDLKRRGLLDDTLVIWGGEFGRTPMSQGTGRDHHTKSGAMFMAGGGIRGGMTYGETDPFGFRTSIDPFHVHDFHATMLHMLGINHLKLTYKFSGRNFRLTDVHGQVIDRILS